MRTRIDHLLAAIIIARRFTHHSFKTTQERFGNRGAIFQGP
jgi:hypothetical protein